MTWLRQAILREAVEQCERLWMPTLHPLQDLDSWMVACPSVAVGVARAPGLPSLSECNKRTPGCGWWSDRKGVGRTVNSTVSRTTRGRPCTWAIRSCAVPGNVTAVELVQCGKVILWMAEVRSLARSPTPQAARGPPRRGYRCRCLLRHGVPGHGPQIIRDQSRCHQQ